MIDAVLSYHVNPYTCGVAKWNLRLARELGVPCVQMGQPTTAQHPLYSVKPSEIPDWQFGQFTAPYDLFLHDWPKKTRALEAARNLRWLTGATKVYAANGVIARHLRGLRPDVIDAWCPSTIETPPPRADLTILTFGMAHKLTSPYYEKLRDLLEAHGEPYTILLSTGVHEGTPWDEALEGAAGSLRYIFDGARGRVEVLGYLSDAALDREIRDASVCAAFFAPALRANNTTAWAVLERGKPLLTNLDDDSPRCGALDIRAIREWPAPSNAISVMGWPGLLERLSEVPCAN